MTSVTVLMFLSSGFLCSKLTTFPFFCHTLTGYFTAMSWMDSWSRPSKHAASPPPLYLLPGVQSTLYCHTPHDCTGPHRSNTKAPVTSPVKYCSQRCRKHKPGKLDHQIESTFVSLLNGSDLPLASTPTPKRERAIRESSYHHRGSCLWGSS